MKFMFSPNPAQPNWFISLFWQAWFLTSVAGCRLLLFWNQLCIKSMWVELSSIQSHQVTSSKVHHSDVKPDAHQSQEVNLNNRFAAAMASFWGCSAILASYLRNAHQNMFVENLMLENQRFGNFLPWHSDINTFLICFRFKFLKFFFFFWGFSSEAASDKASKTMRRMLYNLLCLNKADWLFIHFIFFPNGLWSTMRLSWCLWTKELAKMVVAGFERHQQFPYNKVGANVAAYFEINIPHLILLLNLVYLKFISGSPSWGKLELWLLKCKGSSKLLDL